MNVAPREIFVNYKTILAMILYLYYHRSHGKEKGGGECGCDGAVPPRIAQGAGGSTGFGRPLAQQLDTIVGTRRFIRTEAVMVWGFPTEVERLDIQNIRKQEQDKERDLIRENRPMDPKARLEWDPVKGQMIWKVPDVD